MASILIIDDEVAIASAFAMFFRHDGQHVVSEAYTGLDGVEAYWRLRPDLVLLDVRLPDIPGFDVLAKIREDDPVVIMVTAYGDVPMAVDALKKGAENFLTKPVDLSHLSAAADRALEKSHLRRMNRYLLEKRVAGSRVLVGSSAAMRELARQVSVLAQSERTTGLITGERGSGKGRVAELIHQQSPRAAGPFVEVNCATLTSESLDLELFGEEGAGGKPARRGLFEIADGGTLFLDEIGDLAPQLQPKLLRALEGRGFRRHGGTVEIVPDVRVIAATSRDLGEEVSGGRFREDLYYRLSVMPVRLLPLRERSREDLLELIGQLFGELASTIAEAPTALAEDALEAVLRYGWPGNIRELRNILERSMLLARGAGRIEARHLAREVTTASGADVAHHTPRTLADVERAHIDRTLKAHQHNRTHAAKELGIARATLIKKIKEYDLADRPRGRA
ncbi:MAG: sigma-54-dependent Fis family transcriptional regulator [Gemmatimonadetes bacterium]|nr:sigma-54-dependent Fis family transcriptional regulator [Gemmatimonadota bacterium]